MTSTAGGTQGSSNYGSSGGIGPGGMGGGSFQPDDKPEDFKVV